MHTETAASFLCHGEQLIGILHRPKVPSPQGVLIIVGGPQYRVGSHRQFLLLARFLADQGVPVFRFDYRGMGDSEGNTRSFESITDDILSAIDCFQKTQTGLKRIALWGLCDAASAACFYAHRDPRINGVVLLNPWVRSEAGIAKAYLKHYYLGKLFDIRTWRRLIVGRISLSDCFKSVLGLIAKTFIPNSKGGQTDSGDYSHRGDFSQNQEQQTLASRMLEGLQKFNGDVLLILSGNDLTAAEFEDMVNGSRKWKKIFNSERAQKHKISEADHTFSRGIWRKKVEEFTFDWIKKRLLP